MGGRHRQDRGHSHSHSPSLAVAGWLAVLILLLVGALAAIVTFAAISPSPDSPGPTITRL